MAEPFKVKCYVCGVEAISQFPPQIGSDLKISCPACGDYKIAYDAWVSPRSTRKDEIYLLQASLRYFSERGQSWTIRLSNEGEIIASFPQPTDIFEQLDLVIEHLALKKYAFSGDAMKYERGNMPVAAARTPEEYDYIIEMLEEMGYSRHPAQGHCRLTPEGWQRLLTKRKGIVDTKKIFVAMWFSEETNNAWSDGFFPAIDGLGLQPFRIDRHEHNEMIDDMIIANIRESLALVADFTGDRSGVYFEAGFAKGLGKPVLWTCRTDWMKKLHFDTRQFNHIEWENAIDLKTKLQLRMRATLPISAK